MTETERLPEQTAAVLVDRYAQARTRHQQLLAEQERLIESGAERSQEKQEAQDSLDAAEKERDDVEAQLQVLLAKKHKIEEKVHLSRARLEEKAMLERALLEEQCSLQESIEQAENGEKQLEEEYEHLKLTFPDAILPDLDQAPSPEMRVITKSAVFQLRKTDVTEERRAPSARSRLLFGFGSGSQQQGVTSPPAGTRKKLFSLNLTRRDSMDASSDAVEEKVSTSTHVRRGSRKFSFSRRASIMSDVEAEAETKAMEEECMEEEQKQEEVELVSINLDDEMALDSAVTGRRRSAVQAILLEEGIRLDEVHPKRMSVTKEFALHLEKLDEGLNDIVDDSIPRNDVSSLTKQESEIQMEETLFGATSVPERRSTRHSTADLESLVETMNEEETHSGPPVKESPRLQKPGPSLSTMEDDTQEEGASLHKADSACSMYSTSTWRTESVSSFNELEETESVQVPPKHRASTLISASERKDLNRKVGFNDEQLESTENFGDSSPTGPAVRGSPKMTRNKSGSGTEEEQMNATEQQGFTNKPSTDERPRGGFSIFGTRAQAAQPSTMSKSKMSRTESSQSNSVSSVQRHRHSLLGALERGVSLRKVDRGDETLSPGDRHKSFEGRRRVSTVLSRLVDTIHVRREVLEGETGHSEGAFDPEWDDQEFVYH